MWIKLIFSCCYCLILLMFAEPEKFNIFAIPCFLTLGIIFFTIVGRNFITIHDPDFYPLNIPD